MASIEILPEHVANQIAAGEVVERPSAVVKELVENSLDAGATRVEVEFRHGGKSYIRVEDNGCGMPPHEAEKSLIRHATSKLRDAKDLESVLTFGFRGEALPSIASVARFTLQTRARGAREGVEILVEAGTKAHCRAHGMPEGTRIVVEHLFSGVPARRKFLKTDATESAHIVRCVRLYATAHPSVAFRLIENGREIFSSPKDASLLDRVCAIWGERLRDELMPFEAAPQGDLMLGGLIGKAGTSRPSRAETVIFANNRPVDCPALVYALLEGYRTFIPKGKYPPAFLFFSASPARIDVNVHPAKREIRLKDEFGIRAFITREISKALGGAPLPDLADVPEAAFRPQVPNYVRERELPAYGTGEAPLPAAEPRMQNGAPAASPAAPEAPPAHALDWRLIGVWKAPYWLFESPGGLILFNARAASRRVWYERLLKGETLAPSQALLLPLTLDFEPLTSAAVREGIGWFTAQGFALEPFGAHTYRLDAIPHWLSPERAEAFLREAAAALRERGGARAARNELLARIAAAHAVRRDDALSAETVRRLAADLLACENPLTCPEGKPTYIELPEGDLRKRFG